MICYTESEACDFERLTAPISFHCILRTCLLFNQFCRNFRQSQESFQPVGMNKRGKTNMALGHTNFLNRSIELNHWSWFFFSKNNVKRLLTLL